MFFDSPKNHPTEKKKIVFLGKDFSPVSLGCLKALVANNRYEVLVGIDQRHKPPWQVVKSTWRQEGLRGVARRIVKLVGARTKVYLRPTVGEVQKPRRLCEVAKIQRMETFSCPNVNGLVVRQIIRSFEPDLIVVANFSQIIKSQLRKIPKFGIINFHPSLLPKYRGPNPVYWTIKNREEQSGVTIHLIDEGIDTGDIIMQQEFPLPAKPTVDNLKDRCIDVGAPLLIRSIESLLAGTAKPRTQVDS